MIRIAEASDSHFAALEQLVSLFATITNVPPTPTKDRQFTQPSSHF
jgi:hypothetical protein